MSVLIAMLLEPDSTIPQVLCEAGCLLQKELAAGNKTAVFGVLTNGQLFRFFAIDVDGIVYSSEAELLKIGRVHMGRFKGRHFICNFVFAGNLLLNKCATLLTNLGFLTSQCDRTFDIFKQYHRIIYEPLFFS